MGDAHSNICAFSQIGSSLPGDLSSALVFTATGVESLKRRITQLQDEKVSFF